jgi:fatty acid desaturase
MKKVFASPRSAGRKLEIFYKSRVALLLWIYVSAAMGILLADAFFNALGMGIRDDATKPWVLAGLWLVTVKFFTSHRTKDGKEINFRIW